MGEELIFRIDKDKEGNDVSLSAMSVETAQLLQKFIASLSALAKLQKDPSQVKISVREGSAATAMACANAHELIQTRNRGERKILHSIQTIISANGWNYTVLVNDGISPKPEDVTQAFVKKRFVLTRKHQKWNETVEFHEGQFELPGGKKTNFHLVLPGESEAKITIFCSHAKARRYHAYDAVWVSILKRHKEGQRPDYSLIDYYKDKASFDKYSTLYVKVKNDTSLSRYDALREFVVSRFNEKKYVSIAKLMKLYTHRGADMGLVNTIVMTLKPVMRSAKPAEEGKDELRPIIRLYAQLVTNFKAAYSASQKASTKAK